MDRERWQRLRDLFEQARMVSGEAREALIRSIGYEDPPLADELRGLLAADAATGPLDSPRSPFPSIASLADAAPPQRIGPWRVLREIGRGGMGVVYLAERDDAHFDQRVAIKLIPTTDTNDPLHQRFLAERRMLAGLVHPNIARLLDGGVLDDGRPYLVLEYVDGLPVTAWCDANRVDLEGRLRLFAAICEAVGHAHQNLIIHRDLKPTNILVSSDGRPHLLDFGIAKLIDPTRTESATHHGVRPMTPEYASPEQVRGQELTTASDIYALGVLLYVLLCGRSPYRLTSDSIAELAHAICEQEPDAPSALAARGEVDAASRGVTPERLSRQLKGDLDGIVAMALRKEPSRRYASVDALRLDIERHLSGLAVVAHTGGRRYRMERFVRRHRVAVAATAVMAVGLVTALVLAVNAGRRANRERDRAELALAESERVSDFMMELFEGGDADDTVSAASLTAIDIVRRGAARAGALADQPVVQGRLLDVVGRMSLQLGRVDDAQALLEQAVVTRRALGDSLDLATTLIHLAQVHRTRGEAARATVLATEALELRRAALPPSHPDLADAYYELGWLQAGPAQERLYRQALDIYPDTGAIAEQRVTVLKALSTNLRRQGRLQEALATDRDAVRVAELALGNGHHATGAAMIHLADQVRDLEENGAAADSLYRRGLELLERQFGAQSVRLLHGLNSLGDLLSARGDPEAEQVLRRAIAIRRAAAGPEHPEVAQGLQRLAIALSRQGRLTEAEALQRQALAHTTRVLGERHPSVITSRLPRLAVILAAQGRHREADATFEQALAHPAPNRVAEAELRREYGRVLLERAAHERAEVQLLRALELMNEHYAGTDHPNVRESKRSLMTLYTAWGKPTLVERYRVPPGRYVAY